MNELIGVHFSRQSQLSDPKGQGVRCVPIVHFATATVDWLLETDATAWLLANERIPFRWVTDEDSTAGLKLLYATAPMDDKFLIMDVGSMRIEAPSFRNPDRTRYPIPSDADLSDRHFDLGASLEGFHAIQAFNMISRVSTELGSIAGALKDPRVAKLIDVVLGPARAVIAASVPPPVPTPVSDIEEELLAARAHLSNALSILSTL